MNMSNNVNQSELPNVVSKTARKSSSKNTKPPKPEKLPMSRKQCKHPGCNERILLCRVEAGETLCHMHDEKLITFRKLYDQEVSPSCNHYKCSKFPAYMDEYTYLRYCDSHKTNRCIFFVKYPTPEKPWPCNKQGCCLKSGYLIDERTGFTYCSLHKTDHCICFEFEEFKKCASDKCDRELPKDLSDKYCKLHMPRCSSAIMAGKCYYCGINDAEYGIKIGGDAYFCIHHKEPGMVCVNDVIPLVDKAPQASVDHSKGVSAIIIEEHKDLFEISEELNGFEDSNDVVCLGSNSVSINEGDRVAKFQKLATNVTDEEWEEMCFTNIFDSDFSEAMIMNYHNGPM